MTRPYAFTFWETVGEGPGPGYIEPCLETQRRNLGEHFEHVHLDLASAREWVPEHAELWAASVPDEQGRSGSVEGRRLALYTGMLRVALLRRHGGLWVDADTLVLPRFGLLAPLVEEYDLVCGESSGGSVSNAVLGARPGSAFIAAYWEAIQRRIASRAAAGETGTKWGEFGFRMLRSTLLETRGENCWIAPWGVLDTVDAHRPRPTFTPGATIEDSLSPNALGVSIFNNATEDVVRRRTPEELLAEESLFTIAHRAAVGAAPYPAHLALSTPGQLRGLNRVHLMVRRLEQAEVRLQKLATARRRNADLRERSARSAEQAERLRTKLARRTEQLTAARERAAAQRAELKRLRRRVAELERPFPRLRRLLRRGGRT